MPPHRSNESVQSSGLSLGPLLAVFVLTSCGGGGSDSAEAPSVENQPGIETGTLDDLSIGGITYQSATLNGTTDDSGRFRYRCPTSCETVTFRIGGITLGTATGNAKVSLTEWQGGTADGVLSTLTLRRAQLLYALDENADPTDGVKISAATVSALANRELNFDAEGFDTQITALIDALRNDASLSSSFRNALTLLPRSRVRSLLEQAIAKARGVWVERPSRSDQPVIEVRKYVITFSDSQRIAYTGDSQSLRERYPRGLTPAVGAALVASRGSAGGATELHSITSRGIQVSAPRYAAGAEIRPASVLVTPGPDGSPATATLRVSAEGANLQSLTALTNTAGSTFSGRPTPAGASGSDGARNLKENLQPASPEFDQRGINPSGLTLTPDNELWGCDHYGPFLFRLDSQGRVLERFGPAGTGGALPDVDRALPPILEWRQRGAGCGGLGASATQPDVLWLAMGANLDIQGRTRDQASLIRLIAFDRRTRSTRQYAISRTPEEIDLQILDLDALDDGRLLALLRYRRASDDVIRHEIRLWDVTPATDLSNRLLTNGPNAGRDLEYGTAQQVSLSGINSINQRLILSLQDLGWSLREATGLTQVAGKTLFVMTNANGGVQSQLTGGDPSLSLSEHQVSTDGLISPRVNPGAPAPVFSLIPSDFETRETVIWAIELREAL